MPELLPWLQGVLLQALKPQDDSVSVVSYLNAQAAGGFLAAPVAHFQTNLFLRELGERAIASITTAIFEAPVTCKVIIVPLRGAISRVRVTDTAFALREPGYELDIAGTWSTPAMKADVLRWVKAIASIQDEAAARVEKLLMHVSRSGNCQPGVETRCKHGNEEFCALEEISLTALRSFNSFAVDSGSCAPVISAPAKIAPASLHLERFARRMSALLKSVSMKSSSSKPCRLAWRQSSRVLHRDASFATQPSLRHPPSIAPNVLGLASDQGGTYRGAF